MIIKGIAIIPKWVYPNTNSKVSNGMDTKINVSAIRFRKMTCFASCESFSKCTPV